MGRQTLIRHTVEKRLIKTIGSLNCDSLYQHWCYESLGHW